jgi:hypothetical protein
MNTLLLSIVATAALPTPHFSPGLPLPTPRFGALPVVAVAVPEVDRTMQFDSKGRLIRLPGPRHHWKCPGCNDPTDTMYLGQHLRGREHRVSNATINKVGWWQILVYHDNLHNVNWKPRPVVKTPAVQSTCTTRQGGNCRFPRLRRIFGGG